MEVPSRETSTHGLEVHRPQLIRHLGTKDDCALFRHRDSIYETALIAVTARRRAMF